MKPSDLEEAKTLLGCLAEIDCLFSAKHPVVYSVRVTRTREEIQEELGIIHQTKGEHAVSKMIHGTISFPLSEEIGRPLLVEAKAELIERLKTLGVEI